MKKYFHLLKSYLLILLISSLLVSCSKNESYSDLNKFIHQEKAKVANPDKVIPALTLSAPVSYQSTKLRSPFASMQVKAASNKGPLTFYSLSTLKFIGTIAYGDKRWAAILAPDGKVYEVTVGDYLGENNGRVISLTESELVASEQADAGQSKPHLVRLRVQTASIGKIRN